MAATEAETFGRQIYAARIARGLTMGGLARAINARTGGQVSRQIVAGWENSYRYAPSAEVLIAVAEVLDLDPIALLHAAGKVHPDVTAALAEELYHRTALDLAIALAIGRADRIEEHAA